MNKRIFKIVITLVMLNLFQHLAFAQTNPVPYSANITTVKDTINFGISGDKILTVENLGAQTSDTIFIYPQMQNGSSFQTTAITLGQYQKAVMQFVGSKIILKSNRSSVFTKYYLGDLQISNMKVVYSLKDTLIYDPEVLTDSNRVMQNETNIRFLALSDSLRLQNKRALDSLTAQWNKLLLQIKVGSDSATAQNKRALDSLTYQNNTLLLQNKVVSDSATAQNKRALDSLTKQDNCLLLQVKTISDSATAQNKRALDSLTKQDNYLLLQIKTNTDSATAQNKRKLDSVTVQWNLLFAKLDSINTRAYINILGTLNTNPVNDFFSGYYSVNDTNCGVIDTISRLIDLLDTANSFHFTVGHKIKIVTDSTLEVSTDITFPKNKIVKINPGAYTFDRHEFGTFDNLYIRKKLAVGTTEYSLTIEYK